MLVLTLVRCSVRPICSAMPMNRLLKMDSCTASGTFVDESRTFLDESRTFLDESRTTLDFSSLTSTPILRSPYSVTSATQPGSMMHVAVPFMTTHGPSSKAPAPSCSNKNTGASLHPPSKYTRATESGSGRFPGNFPSLRLGIFTR